MPPVTTDDDTVLACPGCDVAGNVYRRGDPERVADGKRYRCEGCLERFDEPVERKPKGPTTGGRRAKHEETLLAMDPDDLPATGGAT